MTDNSRKRKRDGSSLLTRLDVTPFAREKLVIKPAQDDLVFQLLECESASKDKQHKETSLIRLHGITEDAKSVAVLVRGFHQYVYFPISKTFSEADLTSFEEAIYANVKDTVKIHSIEIVKRDPLDFYRQNPENYQDYVKIYLAKPSDLNPLAKVLGNSDQLPKFINLFSSGRLYSTQIYESGLTYDMRFMCDTGLVGCGWVRLNAGTYTPITSDFETYERFSGAFECSHTAVQSLSPDPTIAAKQTNEWSKLAPLRCMVLSAINLDSSAPPKTTTSPKKPKTSKIAARAKNSSEPEPFIASISVILTTSALESSDADSHVILTHRHTASSTVNDSKAEVLSFQTETQMLQAFRDLWLTYDPDVVSGYDITSEAIPTILFRALDLGLAKDYINLARCSHVSLKTKRRQIYSAAWIKKERKMTQSSNREHTEIGCIGRLVLDLRTVIEREERLRTYSLNESSHVIAGRTLEKLSDSSLLNLWSGSENDLTRLMDYSINEADAALNILRKHASLVTYVELARVTGLNFEEVVSLGQMRRFWSQLFRFCGKQGVIVPGQNRGGEQMTQSALNYMPDVGYDTENPIIVLDFKSLYPSIMIARNLCFSTELQSNEKFEGTHWTGYGGCRFVGQDVKEGIVPQILKHFISERGRVKAMMKAPDLDPKLYAVLDGRQRAIKVVANAVYGFMGARESNYPNLSIADGTITEGANLLETAKQEIEKRYNTDSLKVKVVYGDTDSVFVKCFGNSVSEAIDLGHLISKEVSEIWPDPIQLDFEKILFPSLLQNRKRYAGLLWTTAEAPQGIDIKGIETNRRDAVPLIGQVIGDIFDITFPHKNNSAEQKIDQKQREDIVSNVKDSVRRDVTRIVNGELEMGNFIMTKGLWLGTDASDYSSKQAHISVIDKMRARDSRRMFKDGERISYVFTAGAPNAKGYERAEDPVYVIDKGLVVDYQYYLDRKSSHDHTDLRYCSQSRATDSRALHASKGNRLSLQDCKIEGDSLQVCGRHGSISVSWQADCCQV